MESHTYDDIFDTLFVHSKYSNLIEQVKMHVALQKPKFPF